MTDLFLDFETYSECSLKDKGVHQYARHPSTRPLMLNYALDDGDVVTYEFYWGLKSFDPEPPVNRALPKRLLELLRDPEVTKRSWNAQFETQIFIHTLGLTDLDYSQWRCTMVRAQYAGYPAALAQASAAFKLEEDQKKLHHAKALLIKFCTPQQQVGSFRNRNSSWTRPADAPEAWARFVEYGRTDVVAERAIFRKIEHIQIPDFESDNWAIDQVIMDKGVPVDLAACRNAERVVNDEIARLNQKFRKMTGFAVSNTGKTLTWCQDRGYPYEDMRASTIVKALARDDISQEVKDILEIRQLGSKSSVKKFTALQTATGEDGLMRGSLRFYGAQRTGRAAGQKAQIQNLPRPMKKYEKDQEQIADWLSAGDLDSFYDKYDKPIEALSSAIRPMIAAPRGHRIVAVDLSAIENRVVGWLCNEDRILDVFRQNRDPYIDFAQYLYKKSYDELFAEYKAGNGHKRQLSKPAVLGAGYGLSAGERRLSNITGDWESTGLLAYAENMGVSMEPEMAQLAIRTWRKAYPAVPKFWREFAAVVGDTILDKKPRRYIHLRVRMDRDTLVMRLPSGRELFYPRASTSVRWAQWDADARVWRTCSANERGATRLFDTTYYEPVNGVMVRQHTHGGKLLENATQAVARDILLDAVAEADAQGIDVRFHVHDEIVAIEKDFRARLICDKLTAIMSRTPSWAEGLPLGAKGTISRRYVKD